MKAKKDIGVTHYLSDSSVELDDVIMKNILEDGIDLIPIGVIAPNPVELLLSKRLDQLIEELKSKYDYIVIDNVPLGVNHILPALSTWISAHDDLNIHFEADNQYVDMIEERIDIAIRMSPNQNDNSVSMFPLTEVRQLLVASPHYLRQQHKVTEPKELTKLNMIGVGLRSKIPTSSI